MFDKSETKTVYIFDENQKYACEKILDYTDRSQNSGEWQIPWGCVEINPPPTKAGFDVYWNGTAWEYRAIPAPDPEPEPTLNELKDQKILEFKMLRDAAEVEIIEYNNKTFDYDDKSRERMRIAEKALVDNNIANQLWTCADNTQIELNVQDFKNINSLAAHRSGQLHDKYNQLKDQVNDVTDKAALELIAW